MKYTKAKLSEIKAMHGHRSGRARAYAKKLNKQRTVITKMGPKLAERTITFTCGIELAEQFHKAMGGDIT